MSYAASNLTGIKIINLEIFFNDDKVVSNTARQEFMKFLWFLKEREKRCILVAHNGFK